MFSIKTDYTALSKKYNIDANLKTQTTEKYYLFYIGITKNTFMSCSESHTIDVEEYFGKIC